MSERALSMKETSKISAAKLSTAVLAGRSRKSNVQNTLDMCNDAWKQSPSSYKKCRSSISHSSQQGPKVSTHFGRHLLENLKKVRDDLKVKKSNKDNRMGGEESTWTYKKNTAVSRGSSIHARSVSPKKVIPFCEELFTGSKQNKLQSQSPFSSPYTPFEPMEQSTSHKEHSDWSNSMSQSSFSQEGTTNCDLQQNLPPWFQNQRQQLDTQKPNEAVFQDFRRLGLSFDQVLGLECLGLNVSRFLAPVGFSSHHDYRIPPSFDLDGASCYWCESKQHIAYGVAFILKDDSRVIGVEVEWSTHSKNVALIQIAIADIVLLIPMGTASLPPPKALRIIFQDTEIIKTGVNIEMNLRALWVNFQIESNSFVELTELLQFASPEFGYSSSQPESPVTLQAIGSAFGYQNWNTQEMIFSNWECHPLGWKKLHYAARKALITIRIFWRIVLDRKVSKPIHTADLHMNIGQFFDVICKRWPISKKYGDAQVTHDGHSYELPSHLRHIITPIIYSNDDSIKNDSFNVKNVRLSTSRDIPPGLR